MRYIAFGLTSSRAVGSGGVVRMKLARFFWAVCALICILIAVRPASPDEEQIAQRTHDEVDNAVRRMAAAFQQRDFRAVGIEGRYFIYADEAVADQLAEFVAGGNAIVRVASIHALGILGIDARQKLPLLEESLRSDSDEDVRMEAALAIAKVAWLNADDAVEELIHALGDKSDNVKMATLSALVALGQHAVGAIPSIESVMMTEDAHHKIRSAAILGLARIGRELDDPEPVRHIVDANDEDLGHRAAFALGELGEAAAPAVPQLLHAIQKDPDEAVRWAAPLGKIGKAGKPALPVLLSFAADDSHGNLAREECLTAIGAIGVASTEVLEGLTTAVRNPKLRGAALRAIAELGTDAAPLAKLVSDVLVPEDDDSDWDDWPNRREAATTLGRIRSRDASTIGALVKGCTDTSAVVRYRCFNALSDVGVFNNATYAAADKGLGDWDSGVCLASAALLLEQRPDIERSAGVLIGLATKDLKRGETNVDTILVLGANRELIPRVEEVFAAILETGTPYAKAVVTQSLQTGKWKDPSAFKASLETLLSGDGDYMRSSAAVALLNLFGRHDRAAHVLKRVLLRGEIDDSWFALKDVSESKSAALASVDTLKLLVESPYRERRQTAKRAIESIKRK